MNEMRAPSLPLSFHLFSHHLLSLLPLMVIYLATNQGCSPKAVSEAHSPERRCSHLDIHKEKNGKEKGKKKKKTLRLGPSAPSFGFCGV